MHAGNCLSEGVRVLWRVRYSQLSFSLLFLVGIFCFSSVHDQGYYFCCGRIKYLVCRMEITLILAGMAARMGMPSLSLSARL